MWFVAGTGPLSSQLGHALRDIEARCCSLPVEIGAITPEGQFVKAWCRVMDPKPEHFPAEVCAIFQGRSSVQPVPGCCLQLSVLPQTLTVSGVPVVLVHSATVI